MPSLPGLDKIVGSALKAARVSVRATLVKVAAGPGDPADPTAGTLPTRTSYAVDVIDARVRRANEKGLAASLGRTRGTVIEVGQREIVVLGGSLPAGVTPAANDEIVDEDGQTVVIDEVAEIDPARATYTCICRGGA